MSVNYAVLLVEPDHSLRFGLAQRLERRGYHVTAVEHPRKSLAAATFHDYRVVLAGEQLPDIDAPELFERLRRLMGSVASIAVTDAAHRPQLPHVDWVERSRALEEVEQAVTRAMDSHPAGSE